MSTQAASSSGSPSVKPRGPGSGMAFCFGRRARQAALGVLEGRVQAAHPEPGESGGDRALGEPPALEALGQGAGLLLDAQRGTQRALGRRIGREAGEQRPPQAEGGVEGLDPELDVLGRERELVESVDVDHRVRPPARVERQGQTDQVLGLLQAAAGEVQEAHLAAAKARVGLDEEGEILGGEADEERRHRAARDHEVDALVRRSLEGEGLVREALLEARPAPPGEGVQHVHLGRGELALLLLRRTAPFRGFSRDPTGTRSGSGRSPPPRPAERRPARPGAPHRPRATRGRRARRPGAPGRSARSDRGVSGASRVARRDALPMIAARRTRVEATADRTRCYHLSMLRIALVQTYHPYTQFTHVHPARDHDDRVGSAGGRVTPTCTSST